MVIPFLGFSQQPSHFKIGEEELSGIDIYDIIQDNNSVYWLATNQGIIKFDGYSFSFIECPEMLSNSVFSLKMDSSHAIFCNNLNGQIFKVKNDTCQVYFQVPDSLMSPYIYYEFDSNNDLIIASNSIFKVNSNKQIDFLISKNKTNQRFTEIFKTHENTFIIFDRFLEQLVFIKDNQVTSKKINLLNITNFIFHCFYLDNRLYFYNISDCTLLDEKDFLPQKRFNFQKGKKELLRYYSDNTNLWISKQLGGVCVFDKNFNPLFNGNTLFNGTIISSIYKDNEGNSILGTFGEGLIVISNFNSQEINIPETDNKITRITTGNNNDIYLGTQSGKIYLIDSLNKASLYQSDGEKNIELLEFIPSTNQLLFDKKETIKKFGVIKDIFLVEKTKYLFASNNGVSWVMTDTENPTIKYLNNFKGRTNCIGYDPSTKNIYAGTAMGLKIGNNKHLELFNLNGKTLICKDILFFEGKIFVTTQNNGVLIFQNDKLINNWTTKTGLISNTTKHIKQYQNRFYISTNMGMQVLNEEGKPLYILNKSTGLYTNNIIDFEISNSKLWLVHQKGAQNINIADIQQTNFTPSISLTKLIVNDAVVPIKNHSNFSYSQNKFKFIVSSISLKHSDEISYYYQLEGLDEKWQSNSYHENKIEYKSLPAGDFVFKIKAVYQNNESNLLSYPFSIKAPFWATWWFYLIIGIVFIASTIVVYMYQIKKQRKKIQLQNELNASKLIAIQSQMNPHFIFNAINSIQDLILQGDIDNSYSYIIKFSNLVRQTLHFSDKEFIDIEEEIELLGIYLELEKLRFKADFEYQINAENIDDIQVPPMLIQPFVENAIKHGLLHKEGIKKLDITFRKTDILTCTVTDNGVGRKKAQEIKARQQKNHESFSVNATKSRFEIMKKHYQEGLGIDYEDLETDGEISGTMVIIKIPFRQNY